MSLFIVFFVKCHAVDCYGKSHNLFFPEINDEGSSGVINLGQIPAM